MSLPPAQDVGEIFATLNFYLLGEVSGGDVGGEMNAQAAVC